MNFSTSERAWSNSCLGGVDACKGQELYVSENRTDTRVGAGRGGAGVKACVGGIRRWHESSCDGTQR